MMTTPAIIVVDAEEPVVLGAPHTHHHSTHHSTHHSNERGFERHISEDTSSDTNEDTRDCCLGGACNECSRHCGENCCGREECCDQVPCCQNSSVCRGCNKFCCDDECGRSCGGKTCCCVGAQNCCRHDPCGDCCGEGCCSDECCLQKLCLRDRCCKPQDDWSRVWGCCPLSTFHLTVGIPFCLIGMTVAIGMAVEFIINKVSGDIANDAGLLEKLKEGVKSLTKLSTLFPTVINLILAFFFLCRVILILLATCCRSRCAARGLDCGFRTLLVFAIATVGVNLGFYFSGDVERSTGFITFLIAETGVVGLLLLTSRCAENAAASLRAVVVAGGNGFERQNARHIQRHGDREALL